MVCPANLVSMGEFLQDLSDVADVLFSGEQQPFLKGRAVGRGEALQKGTPVEIHCTFQCGDWGSRGWHRGRDVMRVNPAIAVTVEMDALASGEQVAG